MRPLTYVVVDIESDGHLPGRHSLLNLAAVATDEAGAPLATFVRPDPRRPSAHARRALETSTSAASSGRR